MDERVTFIEFYNWIYDTPVFEYARRTSLQLKIYYAARAELLYPGGFSTYWYSRIKRVIFAFHANRTIRLERYRNYPKRSKANWVLFFGDRKWKKRRR